MDIFKAFEILKLATTATPEDIESKFKSLVKTTHPDKGGDNDAMQQLNEARDIALRYANNKDIVAIAVSQYTDIIKVQNAEAIKRQEYRSEGDRIILKISKIQKSKITQVKEVTKIVGIVAGALGLLTSNMIPAFDEYFKLHKDYSIIFFTSAFFVGIFYLMLNNRVEKIQTMIDELKEHIEDKETLFSIVLSISKQKHFIVERLFCKRELEDLIENWVTNRQPHHDYEIEGIDNLNHLRRSIRRIGIPDFTKFFITKALEKGFVKQKETRKRGAVLMQYQFLFENE